MGAVERSILLVDDEAGLADTLRFNLECDGFAVTVAYDGLTAAGLLSTRAFDLVILDVMLPEIDGYQICRQFRATNQVTPVIFLTARGGSSDRIHGLKLGANDYLGKPFEYDELLLRMNNLLTISTKQTANLDTENVFSFGSSTINFDKMSATGVNGETLYLSKIEYEMMKFFILNNDRVISREEIYKNIWGYKNKAIPNSRTLDNFIVALRKYFEPNPSQPRHIISVRGFGYKFIR